MPNIEITNMVMVMNHEGKVLVLDRLKKWKGLSFPGGHVEAGESIVDSAIREIEEETGLKIQNLKSCGIVHWFNQENGDRYLEFLYRTTEFSGELIEKTEEGRVFWMDSKEFQDKPLSPNFKEYLPMFFTDTILEAFFTHGGSFQSEVQYKKVINI